jgi:hypothetical protein
MKTCTSCTRKLPDEAFIRNGKLFKTCSACLSKKGKGAKKKVTPAVDVQTGSTTEALVETVDFKELSDYVADATTDLEPDAKVEFEVSIKFDNETLTSTNHDIKLLAKAVIAAIEDGDGYSWV